MTKFAVLAKPGWASARRLAAVLDARIITKEPSLKIKGRVLINYGRSDVQHIEGVVNRNTANATDKLSALRLMQDAGVPTISFFTEAEQRPEKKTIYARTLTRSKKGKGIVIVEPEQPLPKAPLYTVRFPNKYEYRVHVCFGEAIHIQRRVKRPDVEGTHLMRASEAFVLDTENLQEENVPRLRERLAEIGGQAIAALGLDFGAVDVLYSARNDSFVVCEVNTAPGMEAEKAEKYGQKIKAAFANV